MIDKIEPLKEELRKSGIEIDNIYDLLKIKTPYPTAIPLLLDLLKDETENYRFKEGVIRALATKEAKGIANSILLEEYNKTPKDRSLYRWAIGNTINVTITKDIIDDIISIVRDKTNGMSREMFAMALGKLKLDKSEDVLIELLNDDEVAAHALDALGKLKSVKAKGKIQRLLSHPKPLIRKEAEKALKKIEKA